MRKMKLMRIKKQVTDETEWCMFLNPDSNSAAEQKDEFDDMEERTNLPVSGLHWEVDVSIPEVPPNKMPTRTTSVKQGYEHLFKMPIDSVMAMMPVKLWEVIVEEMNRYAEQKILKKKRNTD